MIFFSTAPQTCKIDVLSVDSKYGPQNYGAYFNFNRANINLATGQTLRFVAYNMRTSLIGEVIVWGSTQGGSVGDSHGRFNRNKVISNPGQWEIGDELVPVDPFICRN